MASNENKMDEEERRSCSPTQQDWSLSASKGFTPALCVRVVTSVTGLADGYDLGCISGALVIFREELALSTRQVGVVVGSTYFAMAVGAPFAGMLADAVGRKIALGLSYILLIAGSLATALATGFSQLVLGRVVLGLGIGAGFAVVSTYITEVSPKRYRGCYVGLEDIFLVIGVSVGYSFNYLLVGLPHDWRLMLGLGAVPPLIALCLLFLPQLPESPRWNMLQGNQETAKMTLNALVGEVEAKQMLEDWKTLTAAPCTWLDVLRPQGEWHRQAILASVGVTFISALSAIAPMTVYMGSIFSHELPEKESFLLSAVMGFMRVAVISVTLTYVLDSMGRRPLLLISNGGVVLSLLALAFLYWIQAPALPMKVMALFVYLMSYSVGLAAIPFVYSAEVLPTELRSKGVSFGIFVSRISAGCITYSFPQAQETFGSAYVFGGLAIVNAAGFVFLWCCAPETVGVSLEEMHHIFRKAGRMDKSPPSLSA